jgi:hypothetical protein
MTLNSQTIRSRIAAFLRSTGIVTQRIIPESAMVTCPGPIVEDLSALTSQEHAAWLAFVERIKGGYRPSPDSPEIREMMLLKSKIRHLCHCGNPSTPHELEQCRAAITAAG